MMEVGAMAARAVTPEGDGAGAERPGATHLAAGEAPVGGEADAAGVADAAATEESAAVPVGGLDEGQLARLREVLVAAHPDAVPELIAGADFDSLLGSVAGARTAFARVRDEAARAAAGGVPRGGGTREIDPAVFAGLSPEAKIAQGLQRR